MALDPQAENGELTTDVAAAWRLRAAGRPEDAVAIGAAWIGRGLPKTANGLAELGELYRCASLCADGVRASLWRERSLLAFALADCGNGLATLLVPVAFGLLRDQAGSAALALNWLEGMTSLIGKGCVEGGPSTSLTKRLYYEKKGYLQHEAELFTEAVRSYASAAEQINPAGDPRAWAKVRLGAIRPKWELSANHVELVRDQEAVLDEVRLLGDRAADILASAEANLQLMRGGERPAHPYELV
jgi:hypothetical protein